MKLGIIVFSCDKYSDLWESFFYFFNKFWADCPYPIYLSTNSKPFEFKNVSPLYSNQTSTWGQETIASVSQYPYDYFIYFQEDYFLTKKVNNQEIASLFNKMLNLNAQYLRLFPSPGADQKTENENDFGIISIDAPYRTSTQCSIWKTDTFKSIIQPQESAWQFELNSPIRSKDFLFLSMFRKDSKNPIYPINYYYMTAVYKGKWLRKPLNDCIVEGLTIDLNYRKVESNWDIFYRKTYHISPVFVRHLLDFSNKKINKKQFI